MGEVIDLQPWLDRRAIDALIEAGARPNQAREILSAFDASLLDEFASEHDVSPCDTD